MPEVKMQAEQQPRHTDETDDEFNERNQQYNQDENEKANEENGHSGWQSLGETALESSMSNSKDLHEKTYDEALREGVLPEGVRDEQDYREYLSEKNARAVEATEHDHAMANEIERIENPYDKNLVLSIIPRFYDENGDRRQKENEYFDSLSLAIEYANRNNSNTSIEEFAEYKISQRKQEIKDKGIDYHRDREASKELYRLRNALDALKRASHYSEIQKETDNNEQSIAEIDKYFKNDERLRRYRVIPTIFRNNFSNSIEDSDFSPINAQTIHDRHLDLARQIIARPAFDKGIATVMAKDLLQEYQQTNSEDSKIILKDKLYVLADYYRGEGFNMQMDFAMQSFKENCYDVVTREMDKRSSDILHSDNEPYRFRLVEVAKMMSIYDISGQFRFEQVQYADYLDDIEDGKKILAKF